MRTIPNSCLEEKNTTCIIYTGEDIPHLDIKNGDSLEYVVSRLATVTPSEDETSGITVSTFAVPVLSACAAKLVNTKLTYEISARVNSLYFSWDISSVLPSGYGYTSTTVEVISTGVIADSNTRAGTLTIPVSSLPVNVRIEQRVSSSCGEVVLHYNVPVTGSMKGEFSGVFQIRDLTSASSELTLNQAFDTLFAMAVQTQQQIDDFRATEAAMEISKLDARLTTIENTEPDSNDEVTYLDQNISETEPVGDALTSAFEIIRANEAKVKVLEAEIESLRTLISQS